MRITNTTQAYIYLDDAQASESDGYVEFTVTVRPMLRTTPVLVRYATVDGTAIAGSDYTREVETGQTYKILVIPAGQSSATIRIPIIDDQVYESADETFTLQLTNHNNKAMLDGDATSLTATGAIADDDPKPVVSVAGPAGDVSYVSENAKDPVTFTLTLMGQSAGDVTVDYATGEAGLLGLLTARQGLAGATQDEDYAGTSGTVTFTPGQTTKTVTVQVTNDDVSEETEFFGFTISAPQGADLRGQRSEDVADVGLLDDDPRGVPIAPTSIGLDEPASGETAVAGSYTVNLNSRPTDTVTVTIGGSDPAVSLTGGTLTNNQLTFTTTNWNAAQTITVTPVNDDNAVGETITLTHTLSGGDYAGIAADSVTVNLTDSDTRNLVLSGQSLTVTEGDATGVRYTVKLATQPSDTVTVTISGHDGADLTLSGTTLTNNQLTFTTTNWGTAQTVTVKAGDDDDTDNESETLAHTAFGGDYVNVTKDLPVSIDDEDVPQVTVSFDQAAYTVPEGGMVTVTVTLSADPERTVEIDLTAEPQGGATSADYSGVPTSVTFAAGQTEQMFTFSATQDDEDDDGEKVLLAFGTPLPEGVSAGTTTKTTVSITDDDVPQVTVSFNQAAHTVAEGDMVTVTVTLSADPERTVEIAFTATDQDGATSADYSGVPMRVTFAAGQTEQMFMFRATQDQLDDDGEKVLLAFGTPLPQGVSAGTTAATTVTITDDDTAGVSVSNTSLTIAEGSSGTYTIVLDSEPTATVTVTINDPTDNTDVTAEPTSLAFSSTDWNVLQTVTVRAAHDNDTDNETATVTHTVTSTDSSYSSASANSVAVSVTDDDPDVTVSFGAMSYTVAEGNPVTVTVTLSEAPGRELTVPITRTNQGASDSDYTGVPASVTFSPTETSQTITFRATQDEEDDGGEKVLLAFGTPLPQGVSAGTTAATTVTITDDDTAGVSVSRDSLTIAEGSSGTYSIVLDSQPTATVTVTINDPTDNTDVTADQASLTFSSTDWNTPQLVTVSAAHDNDTDNETATVTHTVTSTDSSYGGASANSVAVTITDDDPDVTVSFGAMSYTVAEGNPVTVTISLDVAPGRELTVPITRTNQGSSDSDYTGVPASVTFSPTETSQTITFRATQDQLDDDDEKVLLAFGTPLPAGVTAGTTAMTTVSITDDDTPGVSVSRDSLTIAEGSSGTYTIVLDSQPTATVTVTINDPTDNTDVTADPASLTFSSTDWNVLQTVRVSATQDNDTGNETATVTHTVTSTDSSYSSASANSVAVSVTDDDPDVTVSFGAMSYTVAEGNPVTVTVSLDLAPGRELTVPITRTNQGASDSDYMGVPASVTFSPTERSQTITFRATQDEEDDGGEKVLLAFGTPLPEGVSAGTTAATTVTITDDDTAGVSVSRDSLTIAEGSSGTYTIVLDSQPTATVTVTINDPTDNTDVTADQASLTFSPTDWNVPQTVTVRAAHDNDTDNETATVTHTVTSTDSSYGGASADSVAVSVTDDDPDVTVSFGAMSYTVAEGNPVTVTVTLSEAPGRELTIPITRTNQGASDSDYTGVPASVTFSQTETSQMFAFRATQDEEDDGGEKVLLAFGTPLPQGVSAGAQATTTVTITDDDDPPVNDPPTAANGTVTTNEDTDHTFAAADFSYADSEDNPLESVKITGLPTAGTLTLDGTAIVSGALPETVAAADLTASKLKYSPPANANGTGYASFTFKVNDGTADSAEYTITINVTAVNDPPTAANGTVTTNEDTDHTFAAADFSYADSEDNPLASVKITGLPTAGTGTLTLDGTAIASGALPQAVAAADLTASKLKYSPPANANGTGYTSFTFKVNDGTADSAEYTMTINVTPVNDPATGAPTISGTAQVGQTLTASTAGIEDPDGVPSSLTYQWKRYAANGTTLEANIGTDESTYTLTESEEGKKVKVEVSFTDDGGSSEGPLVSAPYPASLSQMVGAAPVVNTPPTAANGTATTNEDTDHTFAADDFSYADSEDNPLASVKITGLPAAGTGTLTLDGTAIVSGALPEAVAAADLTASKLKYSPPANANGTGYASFTFKVNDGTADSAEYTITINVTAVNDPPTAANGTVTTNEDTDHTFAAAGFSYADDDSDALESVKITGLPTAGTGTLTLDGTAIASGALPQAVAAADLTASKLKYSPPANANGTGYTSFTFKVNDGTADSAEYTMTINVTPVNDPATGAPTISGTAQVGQTLTASTAGIEDPDGVPSSLTYQWKRYAANGTTLEANIGTDESTYTLTESEEGKKVKVEVSFTDDGGSSEGPLVSAPYPASLSQMVGAAPVVNTPPTAANGTVTTNEDTDHTFAADDFSYADSEDNPLESVKITGLPTAGTLTLDGTAIVSGALPETVAAADLTASKLKYSPPANANGTGYASFSFRVNDGTADSAEYTMTINVTAVNDPPTAANGTVTTNEDTDHTFAAADFSYADSEDNPLASVKITGLPAAGTGTLTLDGTAIVSGALPEAVAAADLTASKLKYSPPANANGTGYASFTFKVNDGTADSAEYTITINVTPVNDPATGAPTISGTAQVGQTLTASTAGIEDPDGVPSSLTYQWKRYAANGTTLEANIGTDESTYTLTESEEGKKVKVEVSFTDDGGSSEGPLVSAAYPASQSQRVGSAPVVNTPPTAANGTVTTNEDTDHTFAADDFSYADSEDNPLESVKITGLPTAGAGTLTLDGTAIVSGALPEAVAAADLTASKLKYSPPANANGTGYASFTFKVNDGTADSAEYTITINVTPVNDPATGTPTISGTAQVGETLTASTASIADVEGVPGSLNYQWIRVGADGTSNPTDIGGNSNTYLLTEADFGKRIKVRVDFTDGQGGAESRTSDAYPRDGTVQRMTVQFEQAAYTVAEGGTVTVTVTLSVDPEHMMVIPIAKENMGGAGSTDYSGVPQNVTFNAGDTSKSFDFDAAQDDEDDDGESVRVVFGSSLPPGVSLGALAETVVRIDDDDEAAVQQQLGGNVGQTGTVVTITRVPDEDGSSFVEGTEALFRLNFEAVGGGPSPGGVDVHLRYFWQIRSPLVTAHGYASQGTWSVPRVDVWDSAVPIHDNDFGNPDGTLTIRIIGCERNGCIVGTPSVLTLTITDDDGGPATAVPGPPGVPRLVCARFGDGYDDTGIAVSWKAPNFVGGAPVESYELRYRESSQFVGGRLIEHRWKSWPHGVAATSATLTGLVPRASYTVQVRAVNGNGPGLWSEPWRFRVGPTDEVCEIIDQLTPR